MTSTRHEQVEWRRNKVQELAVKGYKQSEIIQMLQLNKSTVCHDIFLMKEQAIETIKDHINEKLPFEFIKTTQGFEEILKECWITATKADKEGNTREKLQALTLISETYSRKMDLLTNASLLQDSIKWIENTKEKLSNKVNNKNGLEGSTETNITESEQPVF